MANIRKRYNQVPHLTQDLTWESNKNTMNITKKSQEVNPFPADDQKAAMWPYVVNEVTICGLQKMRFFTIFW